MSSCSRAFLNNQLSRLTQRAHAVIKGKTRNYNEESSPSPRSRSGRGGIRMGLRQLLGICAHGIPTARVSSDPRDFTSRRGSQSRYQGTRGSGIHDGVSAGEREASRSATKRAQCHGIKSEDAQCRTARKTTKVQMGFCNSQQYRCSYPSLQIGRGTSSRRRRLLSRRGNPLG